jgi:hypothetical protein
MTLTSLVLVIEDVPFQYANCHGLCEPRDISLVVTYRVLSSAGLADEMKPSIRSCPAGTIDDGHHHVRQWNSGDLELFFS